MFLIIKVDEWGIIDEFGVEEGLEFFPMLLKGLSVEITIEFFVVSGSGDSCRGVWAAVVMADFVLLDEEGFYLGVLCKVVSDA